MARFSLIKVCLWHSLLIWFPRLSLHFFRLEFARVLSLACLTRGLGRCPREHFFSFLPSREPPSFEPKSWRTSPSPCPTGTAIQSAKSLLSVVGSLFLNQSLPLAFLADLVPSPLTAFFPARICSCSLSRMPHEGARQVPSRAFFLLSAFSRTTLIRAQKLAHLS